MLISVATLKAIYEHMIALFLAIGHRGVLSSNRTKYLLFYSLCKLNAQGWQFPRANAMLSLALGG